jgi:hypothetical protein
VVLPGIPEAPEVEQVTVTQSSCVTPPEPPKPTACEDKPADPTAAQRQQRHRDKLEEKRVANGGKPKRRRMEVDLVAQHKRPRDMVASLDVESMATVCDLVEAHLSRAVQTKKAA